MSGPSRDSTVLSRADVDFLLHDWLRVADLQERDRFAEHSRETIDGLVDLCAELAEKKFAPHNRLADLDEPRLVGEEVELPDEIGQALRAFYDADLGGAAMDADVGGLQLPYTAYLAGMAWLYASNVSTTAYPLLTTAAANMLYSCGTSEQIERFVEPMISGRFFGTMCLSEPQAGSNLADIQTKALPDPGDTDVDAASTDVDASALEPGARCRLFGQKMWISGGEQPISENIVHLVLAKLPGGPAGTKGISLFAVPKYLVDEDGSLGERNDIVITGLNHKMGFRGTTNTIPTLGNGMYTPEGRPGAIGYLVGRPHEGLRQMFVMMNEARLGVGLGATALGYTGYLKSLDYARGRPQGRPVGAGPETDQVMLTEHADVRRMLLAQKSYVEGALALCLYCARLVDLEKTSEADDAAASKLLLDVLTPIAKSWPSQWCLEANSIAIQILGGAGYTRDYDVEQHYRDNRLNPIHEGTHGIQAQDLLGRKVLAGGGAGLAALAEIVERTCRSAEDLGTGESGDDAQSWSDEVAQLRQRVQRLGAVTEKLASVGTSDPGLMLANATPYLEAAGHIVLSWIWFEQVVALGDRSDDFASGKRAAARYFLRWELPKVDAHLDVLDRVERTPFDVDPAWL